MVLSVVAASGGLVGEHVIMPEEGSERPAAADRDQFIPVRKIDIIAALVEHGSLGGDRDKFRQLCRLLGAIYHYEYFDRLERLRADYFYFNPEIEPHERFDDDALERAYADLLDALTSVLKGANFVEVPHAEIDGAHRARAVLRVELKAPLDDYREVRFFRRGHHRETIPIVDWFGLRKRTIEAIVYDDVVLFVALKSEAQIAKRERRRLARDKIRPGSVLIKYFRNIATADLHALYPDVRVVMSTFDKLTLGLPALAGGVPIALSLASTLTVLLLVIGFYLGIVGAVEGDEVKKAFAAMSGLAALGGFVMRQWMNYQRRSLKYQKVLTDHIYFRNINNNAGIFDAVIGAAEDQECKEAFLAYYFLHIATEPSTQAMLEQRIEAWLKATFGVEVEFAVDEALAKLDRLGVLVRAGDRLAVPTLDETLARLHGVWRDFFSGPTA
jgi:hypothetical protein